MSTLFILYRKVLKILINSIFLITINISPSLSAGMTCGAKSPYDFDKLIGCKYLFGGHDSPTSSATTKSQNTLQIKKINVCVNYSQYFKFICKKIGGKKVPWFKYLKLSGKATWIDRGVRRPAIHTPIDIELIQNSRIVKNYELSTDENGKFELKTMVNSSGRGTKEVFVPLHLELKGNKRPPIPKKINGKIVAPSSYKVTIHTGYSRYFKKWRKTILPVGVTEVRKVILEGMIYWKDGDALKPARAVPITLRSDKDGRPLQSKTVYSSGNGQFMIEVMVNPKGKKILHRFIRIPLVLKGKKRPKDPLTIDQNPSSATKIDDLPPEYRKKLATNKKLLHLWIKLTYLKAIYDDAVNRAKFGKGTPNLDALKKDIKEGKEYRAALRMILQIVSSKTEEIAGTGGKVSDINDKLQKLQELLGKKKKSSFGEHAAKTIRHYIDYEDYVINQ